MQFSSQRHTLIEPKETQTESSVPLAYLFLQLCFHETRFQKPFRQNRSKKLFAVSRSIQHKYVNFEITVSSPECMKWKKYPPWAEMNKDL